MNIDSYFDKIDRYATGQMTDAERKAFDADIAVNPDLKQAFDLYLIGNEVIEEGVSTSLRQQLDAWAAEDSATLAGTPTKPRAKLVSMKGFAVRWAVAASLLLAVFALFQVRGAYTDAALFSDNYETPAPSSLRAGVADDSPLEKGFTAFKTESFEAAASFFQSIPVESERYAEAQYWLGHTSLRMKENTKAITAFKNAAQSQDLKIKEKAEWNLVLAYLIAQQTRDAVFVSTLDDIVGHPEHSFHRQATLLKNKLGSFFRKF